MISRLNFFGHWISRARTPHNILVSRGMEFHQAPCAPLEWLFAHGTAAALVGPGTPLLDPHCECLVAPLSQVSMGSAMCQPPTKAPPTSPSCSWGQVQHHRWRWRTTIDGGSWPQHAEATPMIRAQQICKGHRHRPISNEGFAGCNDLQETRENSKYQQPLK